MIKKFNALSSVFDLKNTLIAVAIGFAVIGLNLKWQDSLRNVLNEKKDELSNSTVLLNSKADLENKSHELELFNAMKAGPINNDRWKDALTAIISIQKLVLRQVRPMGIEQRGKLKEDKVFLQVEGDMPAVSAFLHAIGSSELPVYVTQVLLTAQQVGSGFVSAEFVLAKPMFD